MTSLAELGEISKKQGNAPDVEGYRIGRVSRALPTSDKVYFKEGKDARRRRVARQVGYGAAGAGAGFAAAVALNRKRLHFPAGKTGAAKYLGARYASEDTLRVGAPIVAAATAGTLAQQRAQYKSDDMRTYSAKTGKRRMPGVWKVNDHKG